MNKFAVRGFAHGQHPDFCVAAGNPTLVPGLAAAFRIKRRLIQHNHAFRPLVQSAGLFSFGDDGQHLALAFQAVVTDKASGGQFLQRNVVAGPAQACAASGLPSPLALGFHHLLKGLSGQLHVSFFQNFNGQIDGKSIGIIQTESVFARQGIVSFDRPDHLVQLEQTAFHRSGKPLLLCADQLLDVSLLFPQLGVSAFILLYRRFGHFIEKRLDDAQQTAVAGGPAQQTAQHIASALVGGRDAVARQHDAGANMVGNNAQGNVPLFVFTVGCSSDSGRVLQNLAHCVHVKKGFHILHDAGQPLDAHAGVDILFGQRSIIALAVIVKLAEHQIPKLHIPVAVAAGGAIRLAAAILLAPVKINLRTGAAGAGADFPEIIFPVQSHHMVLRHADFLCPDIVSLVVLQKDGDIELIYRHLHFLSDEFPRPLASLPFEIIAKRKIAQHLKISAMASVLADVFNVQRANALLAIGNPRGGRRQLPGKIMLQRGHAGVNQQQRFVVLRHQRIAFDSQMPFAFKKTQESLSNFIQSQFFHFISISF